MAVKGVLQEHNSYNGPRTEPCGSPEVREAVVEDKQVFGNKSQEQLNL